MFCTKCGSELVEGARFCKACGAVVEPPLAPEGQSKGVPDPTVLAADSQPQTMQLGEPAAPTPRSREAWAATMHGSTAQPLTAQAPSTRPDAAQAQAVGHAANDRRTIVPLMVLIVALFAVAGLLAWRLLAPAGIALDAHRFPDEALRSQVAMAADLDGDGRLSPDELARLQVLRVTGVSDFAGLELLTELQELTVAAPTTSEVELPSMPALTDLVVEDASGVKHVSVREAPALETVDASGAPDLEGLDLPEGNDATEVIVPPTTEVTNLSPAAAQRYDLVTSFDYTQSYDHGVQSRRTTVEATYDDAGRILTKDVTHSVVGFHDVDPDLHARYSYDDQGRLAAAEVDCIAPYWGGNWAFDYPDAAHANVTQVEGGAYRKDLYDTRGRLSTRSYSYGIGHDSSSRSEGYLTFAYDEQDRIESLSELRIYDSSSTEFTHYASYDALGRLICVELPYEGGWYNREDYVYDEQGRLTHREAGSTNQEGGALFDAVRVTYVYREDGCLVSAHYDDDFMYDGTWTFVCDEEGRVASADFESTAIEGNSAHYEVSYVSVYAPAGRTYLNAVDLTFPESPVYETDAWWNASFTWRDWYSANQAWLATHRADEGAEVLDGQGESATDPASTGEGLPLSTVFPRTFAFSSGVGAWGTSMDIAADGSFSGAYADSDRGVTGDGYPNGTRYIAEFEGAFSDLVQVGEYEYTLRLARLEVTTPQEEWIDDGVRFIGSPEAYGLGPSTQAPVDGFRLYVPGYPVEQLPDEVKMWAFIPNDATGPLEKYVLVNERGESPFAWFSAS